MRTHTQYPQRIRTREDYRMRTHEHYMQMGDGGGGTATQSPVPCGFQPTKPTEIGATQGLHDTSTAESRVTVGPMRTHMRTHEVYSMRTHNAPDAHA
jgi:hypothetical protein